MNQLQLFNLEGVPGGPAIARPATRPRKGGYAAPPGTGPEGQSCGTCGHYRRAHHQAGVFLKCGLLQHCWTHGPGTDIKAGSPSCRLWEAQAEDYAANCHF